MSGLDARQDEQGGDHARGGGTRLADSPARQQGRIAATAKGLSTRSRKTKRPAARAIKLSGVVAGSTVSEKTNASEANGLTIAAIIAPA